MSMLLAAPTRLCEKGHLAVRNASQWCPTCDRAWRDRRNAKDKAMRDAHQSARTTKPCWHCGWNLNGFACRARLGPYHYAMRKMQMHEMERLNGSYTQLANDSRLYVRRT